MTFNRRDSLLILMAIVAVLLFISVICFAEVPYAINNNNPQNNEYHIDENFHYLETYKAPKNTPIFTGEVTLTSATASGEITTGYGYYHDRGDPAVYDFNKSKITADGNWYDLSFSTIVPSGAKTLLLRVKIKHTSSTPKSMGFRKNGSSNAYNVSYIQTTAADIYKYGDIIVSCDDDRTIEYSCESAVTWSNIEITVGGWWK